MTTLETGTTLVSRRWKVTSVYQDAVRHGRAYRSTFLTEFAVMASQILVYKFAAHYLGRTGFSEYALARRTVSLIFPVPVLGLAVGLPRYIGFSQGNGDKECASRYYGATLWCVGGAALICLIMINLFSKPFAYLFFGDRSYAYFALPLSLIILGFCLHTVVCGYFRGHLAMNRANALQFTNMAVVPIVGLAVFGHSLARALAAIGLMSMLIASLGLLLTPFRIIAKNNLREARELLQYGVQRVPGDFILMSLFTLPATFMAHLKGVQEAGFVAFGVTVVSMIGSVFAPVGLVLLPKATTMLAGGARRELREHLQFILRVTFGAALALILVIGISIPALIRLYLGSGFEQVVPIVRLLVLGALPYSLYLVWRNLVDAYHEFGVTTAILFGGLTVFLTGSWIGRALGGSPDSMLIVFVLALCTLAVLSGLECRRILRD
jgi:O-antigen/teichoic acid export membrane protein